MSDPSFSSFSSFSSLSFFSSFSSFSPLPSPSSCSCSSSSSTMVPTGNHYSLFTVDRTQKNKNRVCSLTRKDERLVDTYSQSKRRYCCQWYTNTPILLRCVGKIDSLWSYHDISFSSSSILGYSKRLSLRSVFRLLYSVIFDTRSFSWHWTSLFWT